MSFSIYIVVKALPCGILLPLLSEVVLRRSYLRPFMSIVVPTLVANPNVATTIAINTNIVVIILFPFLIIILCSIFTFAKVVPFPVCANSFMVLLSFTSVFLTHVKDCQCASVILSR